MMRPCIGLTGSKGAGKDATAAILVAQFGYTRQAFADALKGEVAYMLADPRYERAAPYTADQIVAYMDAHKRDDPAVPTGWPRQLLQAYGMARRDLYGTDYWVRQVTLGPGVVVTDCRFENEIAVIRAAGGVIWRIERPGYEGDPHPSEHAWRGVMPDAVLRNDGDLAHLAAIVQQLLQVQQ